MRSSVLAAVAALLLATAACGGAPSAPEPGASRGDGAAGQGTSATDGGVAATVELGDRPATPAEPGAATTRPDPPPTPPATVEARPARPAASRPAWLGTRPLPRRPDGFGQVLDTPGELADRRLPPPDGPQPAPPPGEEFTATVGAVPDDVAARSTWSPACPVALEDLRYVTVTFQGFDGAAHTGELLVHASAADDLVEVFRRIYEARFPIEEMRVVAADELDAEPTGDGNNTTAFVCRPSVGSSAWSQHAYGLAVDVNPFHNPYARGDLVLPELASAYVDRTWDRPGMIQPGDAVTEAFAAIGWGWGGQWRSSLDWMHFSASGR